MYVFCVRTLVNDAIDNFFEMKRVIFVLTIFPQKEKFRIKILRISDLSLNEGYV